VIRSTPDPPRSQLKQSAESARIKHQPLSLQPIPPPQRPAPDAIGDESAASENGMAGIDYTDRMKIAEKI
jgi:hypothetical protein